MMKVRIQDGGTSPIYRLIKPLCRSVVMIAPERSEQILTLIDNLTLVIWDSDRFACNVTPSARTMNISRRTLEVAWAMSYAYFLKHQRTKDRVLSIEQERDADYEAANWILAKAPGGATFDKRAFGVTMGLAILVGRGIHYGDLDGETHPRTFDRLVSTLERYVADPGDTVWAFAMAVLKLHLDNANIAVPEVVFDTPKDAVNQYVEVLAAVVAP